MKTKFHTVDIDIRAKIDHKIPAPEIVDAVMKSVQMMKKIADNKNITIITAHTAGAVSVLVALNLLTFPEAKKLTDHLINDEVIGSSHDSVKK